MICATAKPLLRVRPRKQWGFGLGALLAWGGACAQELPLLPAQWEFSIQVLHRDDQQVAPLTLTQRVCLRPGTKPENQPLFPSVGGEKRCLISQYSIRKPRFELFIQCDEGDYGSSIALYLERQGDHYVGRLDHNQQERYDGSAAAVVTARPVGPCEEH